MCILKYIIIYYILICVCVKYAYTTHTLYIYMLYMLYVIHILCLSHMVDRSITLNKF